MSFKEIDPSLKGKTIRIENYLDKRGNLYPAGVYKAESLSHEVLTKSKITLVNEGDVNPLEANLTENKDTVPETKIAVKTRSIGSKAPTKAKASPPPQDLTPVEIKNPTVTTKGSSKE